MNVQKSTCSSIETLPIKWETCSISYYISYQKSGLSRKISNEDIGIPVLTSRNIDSKSMLNVDGLKYWYINDPQGADIDNYILEPDDILLCFINSIEQIGKACIYTDIGRPCIYTTNLFRIKATSATVPKFLYYLLLGNTVQTGIKIITKPAINQASFTKQDFAKMEVPQIPYDEQQKIAEILTSADNVIGKTEALIEKYKNIKQGLMQDLLTKGIDEQGNIRSEETHDFKDSPIGRIPKEWVIKSIGELGEIVTGSTPPTDNIDFYGGNVNFFSPADIGFSKYICKAEKTLTEKGLKVSRQIPSDCICVVCIGSTIGKMGLTKDICTTNQQINTLIPFDTEKTHTIYYFLDMYLLSQLRREAGLQAVPIVNKTNFSNMLIPFPNNENEQAKIRQILSRADDYIQLELSNLLKLQNLKQALMQDLLTGKVRVPLEEATG